MTLLLTGHFLQRGRIGILSVMVPGTLIITVGRNNRADLDFLSAADACPCCKHLIQPYDPDSQVVLAVRRGGNEHVYVLSGFPTPKNAHENAPAEIFDEVLH